MICLEEKEKFIVFSCKHKTCTECFTLLLMYSSPCPICDQPIHLPTSNTRRIDYYRIGVCSGCIIILFFYIINFTQKN